MHYCTNERQPAPTRRSVLVLYIYIKIHMHFSDTPKESFDSELPERQKDGNKVCGSSVMFWFNPLMLYQ